MDYDETGSRTTCSNARTVGVISVNRKILGPEAASRGPTHSTEFIRGSLRLRARLGFLVPSTEDSQNKIESISRDVVQLKSQLAVLLPLAKSIGKSLQALVGGVLVFLLTVLGMWIKHHMGW